MYPHSRLLTQTRTSKEMSNKIYVLHYPPYFMQSNMLPTHSNNALYHHASCQVATTPYQGAILEHEEAEAMKTLRVTSCYSEPSNDVSLLYFMLHILIHFVTNMQGMKFHYHLEYNPMSLKGYLQVGIFRTKNKIHTSILSNNVILCMEPSGSCNARSDYE